MSKKLVSFRWIMVMLISGCLQCKSGCVMKWGADNEKYLASDNGWNIFYWFLSKNNFMERGLKTYIQFKKNVYFRVRCSPALISKSRDQMLSLLIAREFRREFPTGCIKRHPQRVCAHIPASIFEEGTYSTNLVKVPL